MTDSNPTWHDIQPGAVADANDIMDNFNYLKNQIILTSQSVSNKESISNKNAANGYCGLDSSGKITQSLDSSVINEVRNTILNTLYPVGSIYISTTNTCPLSGIVGTWTLVGAGRALWTGNGSNGNTTIAAGLPNISGTHRLTGNMNGNGAQWNGCFYSAGSNYSGERQDDYRMSIPKVGFQASRSNSIYGQSSTVQPPAYVVNVWRRTA